MSAESAFTASLSLRVSFSRLQDPSRKTGRWALFSSGRCRQFCRRKSKTFREPCAFPTSPSQLDTVQTSA
eukprot:793882-Amphidinium_carterae.1